MNTNILTKSLFKQALQCPTKLYYATNPGYLDAMESDTFMEALADGGFQVGALARAYYPQGHWIQELDPQKAIRQTEELLNQDEVVIFEAALRFENFFIRVDILHQHDGIVELIEVKAKSYSPKKDSFLTKKHTIKSEWQEYFYDLAFQKYVADRALTKPVLGSLMLVDKSAICQVDGLNQKFQLEKRQGQSRVVAVTELTKEDLDPPLLVKVGGNDICQTIYSQPINFNSRSYEFEAFVQMLKDNLLLNHKIVVPLSKACKDCQYHAGKDQMDQGVKSGFHECWKSQTGLSLDQLEEPLVLDIWNFKKKDDLLNKGIYLLGDVPEGYFEDAPEGAFELNVESRHHLQVAKVQGKDARPFVIRTGLKQELSRHVYPLHFIDFETAMVAIPFTRGRHPYEGIAFQFSHHTLYGDGSIEHAGEYLDAQPGHFPNFGFVRELKRQLEGDRGTIFRYAAHENTYLNMIHSQLEKSNEPDRKELQDFIENITKSVTGSQRKWQGDRNMVDLCEIVKKYHYDPATKGSVSIKYVLPAILNSSSRLQKMFSKPVYGSQDGIKSLNFQDFTWVVTREGKVQDPYTLLPQVFEDLDLAKLDRLSDDDYLKNGGAALMAYCKMQFTRMGDGERVALEKALLKYCELDTLAMVMVYLGLLELLD